MWQPWLDLQCKMGILTAAGTSTPELGVDPAATEEPSRAHSGPCTNLRASPLPELRKTKACLDTPGALQSQCTPAAHTGNSTKCFKSLLFAPWPSVLFPPLTAHSVSLGWTVALHEVSYDSEIIQNTDYNSHWEKLKEIGRDPVRLSEKKSLWGTWKESRTELLFTPPDHSKQTRCVWSCSRCLCFCVCKFTLSKIPPILPKTYFFKHILQWE